MLWAQRKKRRKISPDPAQDKYPEFYRANDSWIKSHFSRLSDERLLPHYYASTSHSVPQPECGSRDANTNIRMETFNSMRGEGGTAIRRNSFTSRQKMAGSLVTKDIHKEPGNSSSIEEATWAAVAACAKEIDAKGHHLANSMIQRAAAHQLTGHLESRDISPEELKALEEVELKLKGNSFTHRETSMAGTNHSHTFYSQSQLGHQSHQSHPSHVYSSHQDHPGHLSHQGHQSHSNYQTHLGHSSHQGHPGHSVLQGHLGHSSHQSHSLPNRSH